MRGDFLGWQAARAGAVAESVMHPVQVGGQLSPAVGIMTKGVDQTDQQARQRFSPESMPVVAACNQQAVAHIVVPFPGGAGSGVGIGDRPE